MGRSALQPRERAGVFYPRLSHRDDRADGADLHQLRRRSSGGRAYRRVRPARCYALRATGADAGQSRGDEVRGQTSRRGAGPAHHRRHVQPERRGDEVARRVRGAARDSGRRQRQPDEFPQQPSARRHRRRAGAAGESGRDPRARRDRSLRLAHARHSHEPRLPGRHRERELIGNKKGSGVEARASEIKKRHDDLRAKWQSEARGKSDSQAISTAFLAYEIGEAIKKYDWALVNGSANGWARKLWDFTKPRQHLGTSGGAGLGYGMGAAIGAALALKDSGTLAVDIQIGR